jgi:type I restriction enzyme M protein
MPPQSERIETKRHKGQIWSHVRKKWLLETPEEAVRQEYLCMLVNDYGYCHSPKTTALRQNLPRGA